MESSVSFIILVFMLAQLATIGSEVFPSKSDGDLMVDGNQVSDDHKSSRFLSLFTVLRIPNEACNSSNGLVGTCFLATECTTMGGEVSGTCSNGIGSCCTFALQTCGNTSSANCTYFQNPGFPSTYNMAQTCSITISRRSNEICQFRLDYLTFDLQDPNNGNCDMDRFTVSGQNTNSVHPPLCGLNTGQTTYVDVSSSQGPITLSVTTAGSATRTWNIKVTQINCNDPNLAPSNCLQYFTGASGTIKSFNFNTVGAGMGYQNNLRYTICFRKEMGFCQISFSNNADFQIEGGAAGMSGVGPGDCANDFLEIGSTRYCGERLNPVSGQAANAPVTDATNGPFEVEVVTNGATNGRGFMVDFNQMACMNG